MKLPRFAIRHINLNVPVEEDVEQALGCMMPVVLVFGGRLPKDDAAGRQAVSEAAYIAGVPQGKVYLLKMGVAVWRTVNSGDDHDAGIHLVDERVAPVPPEPR